MSEFLFNEDPIGINFEDNTDEYEVEVSTILPRLVGVHSVEDVRAIVQQEFVKWFEPFIAGSPERYHVVPERVRKEVLPLLRPTTDGDA